MFSSTLNAGRCLLRTQMHTCGMRRRCDAQLHLLRLCSAVSCRPGTARRAATAAAAARRHQRAQQQPEQQERSADEDETAVGTELVLTLERRGSGWGEEIFPRIALEQRPILAKAPRVRNRSSMPDPWTVRPAAVAPILVCSVLPPLLNSCPTARGVLRYMEEER